MDISADLTYSLNMRHLEDRQSSPFLESLWGVNFFLTMHQVMKKFPWLSPVSFLFIPPRQFINQLRAAKVNMEKLEGRIARRGTTKHLDHFDTILDSHAPDPDKKRRSEFAIVTAQLLTAGWEPPASQFQCCIMFSVQEPKIYELLVKEIRDSFRKYEDITAEALAELPYLHAALLETLRVTVIGKHGLPRSERILSLDNSACFVPADQSLSLLVSPGATVDGHYIPKGVGVQYGHLAFTRSPRYWHEPRKFRPQRFLPHAHPSWDSAFAKDAVKGFFPFSQGPRSCIGLHQAWRETKLFVAKVLFTFDVEVAPGQKRIEFEQDFRMFGIWQKPDFRVKFSPRG